MTDDKRFILAVVLSILILIGYQHLRVKPPEAPTPAVVTEPVSVSHMASSEAHPVGPIAATPPVSETGTLRDRAVVIADSPRVKIVTPELRGSINLKGAELDDLQLVKYHEDVDPHSPEITLLSPLGSGAPHRAYHAQFGWLGNNPDIKVPNDTTVWKADSAELAPNHPLKLSWNNGSGLTFERTISVDDHYMFTILDHVHNGTTASANLYPYALVVRQGDPSAKTKSSVIHEGPLGVLDGSLEEYKYAKLAKEKKVSLESTGGWIGITDKYWLVAMVPPQDEKLTASFTYSGAEKYDAERGVFQSDFRGSIETVAAGGNLDHTTMLFAGAKSIDILDGYAERYKIKLFDRAIDFGWFWILTIPFLHLLGFLGNFLGSFGMAILIFTVMLKLLTLPLSLKSYHSMARMKMLQPEMARIQERFANDKARQGQEMMAFYAREKVNPMSGCLPTLIQIPIFFALYKVLYVSLELRQAPFYGWIKDMSVPDPTSVFTLFGMIAWTPPAMLHVGVWPILMGCSMFLQQKLSPQPPDKTQAQMFAFMPIMFTFMLAQMPAGLVVYWTWSNLLSIVQQWYIMRKDTNKRLPVT